MRRFWAIVRATALEVASDPLALLVTMGALALAVFAPALHYHQFGESSRMAREAGLSALLVGGVAYAVFAAARTVRREMESGTMEMALSHSVSRQSFFFAKLCGVMLAYLAFAVSVAATSLTVVNGAEIGGLVAARKGDVAQLWGPSFALGVASLFLPSVAAAALNRFARFRFVLSATALTAAVSLAGVAYRFDPALAERYVPVEAMLLLPPAVFAAAAGAFAVKWRANAALSATGLFALAFVPAAGWYYLPDVLSKGGSLAAWHLPLAFAATAPLVAAFALLGAYMLERRDLGGEGQ